jgi:hypothetical protein
MANGYPIVPHQLDLVVETLRNALFNDGVANTTGVELNFPNCLHGLTVSFDFVGRVDLYFLKNL